MWAIGVRFLTGNCVATDSTDRDSAEWPPHPSRLYMAMAAAMFETGSDLAERAALEWFETLPAPAIHASAAQARSTVTTFVPVNDTRGGESVGMKRSRQARTFPCMIPDRDTMYFTWPDDTLDEVHRIALARVLQKVSRIGHSSSLVQSWLETELDSAALDDAYHVWEPDDSARANVALRRFFPGTLRQMETAYNAEAIEAYAALAEELSAATGKQKAAIKSKMTERFGGQMPGTRRLDMRVTAGYRVDRREAEEVCWSNFDEQMMILAIHDGPSLGSETTLRLTTALRGAVLSQFASRDEIPEWVSGHVGNGGPSGRCHLAIVPLPFVGDEFADGHLLGAALVFPRDVPPSERAASLRSLLVNADTGEDAGILLTLGPLGVVRMRRESRPSPPLALRAQTWTRPSNAWATATPIVLDRFPKCDRDTERIAWLDEVSRTIEDSCERVGLPRPTEVRVNHNAYLRGVPRARPHGGGFPAFPHRSGNGSRYMVHALLVFDRPVCGPVLLGAGRYQGYGLCKPYELKEPGNGET